MGEVHRTYLLETRKFCPLPGVVKFLCIQVLPSRKWLFCYFLNQHL